MSDLSRLEAEVCALAAEVQRQRRRAHLAAVVVIAGGMFAGMHWDDRIRTRSLDIVDPSGATVMSLSSEWTGYGPTETHGAVLLMNDGTGHTVRLANNTWSGSSLEFRGSDGDPQDRPIARFYVGSKGDATHVALSDAFGAQRILMDVNAEDQVVKVIDKSGTMHAAIGGADREQGMFLGDPHGGPSFGVQATADGIGFIGR